MATYFITWFTVILLGILAQNADYYYGDELSFGKIQHSGNAKLFYGIATIILIAVAGFRYYIGSDYYAYYGWYAEYAGNFFIRLKNLNEPGISFIYWLTVKFVNDGAACVFAANAIMIFIVLRTLKDNTDQLCLAIILYSLICWTATFNGMRQALATAVLFCGYPALRDKRFYKFMIFVGLAYLCHKSSIVMIALYFAVHRKVDVKNILLTVIVGVILLYSTDTLFDITGLVLDKELNTSVGYIANNVNMLRTLSNVAPAVFFLMVAHGNEQDEREDFYLNLLIVHALISVATQNSAYLARLSIFSAPFEVIAVCELLKRSSNNRKILECVIVILFFVFQTYQVMHSADLSPFHWIWERTSW